jgi:hypothetical protein
MKKHGRAGVFVTDKLRSCGAALRDLGAADRQETGRWLNKKFASVHASVTNHFNSQRSLSSRPLFKANRRRPRRVARSLRGIRDSVTVLAETSSNWSDSTRSPPAGKFRVIAIEPRLPHSTQNAARCMNGRNT